MTITPLHRYDEPATAETLAGYLRRWRKAEGVTRTELAARLDVAATTVRGWEDVGRTPLPMTRLRLAEVVGLTAAQLTGLCDPAEPDAVDAPDDKATSRLTALRVRRGLSAAELARQLGVTRSTVSLWGSGRRRPAARIRPVLARVLGVGIDRLTSELGATADGYWLPGIAELRRRLRLTQADLAAEVGVHVRTIAAWEQRRNRVTPRHVPRLAAALGVPEHALLQLTVPVSVTTPFRPLRELRTTRSLRLRDVAAACDVSISTVRAWEVGARTPTWSAARRLAGALDVTLPEMGRLLGLPPPRALSSSQWRAGLLPVVLADLKSWQGWTSRQLADLLGCTATTLRTWECGAHLPSGEHRERLVALLGRAEATRLFEPVPLAGVARKAAVPAPIEGFRATG